MTSKTEPEFDRAAHRAAIERIIAHYPDINEDELLEVLSYIRRDASALDRATIAANPEVYEQYRRLSDDHRLDRLSMVETVIAVLFVFLLVVGILMFTLGDWEL